MPWLAKQAATPGLGLPFWQPVICLVLPIVDSASVQQNSVIVREVSEALTAPIAISLMTRSWTSPRTQVSFLLLTAGAENFCVCSTTRDDIVAAGADVPLPDVPLPDAAAVVVVVVVVVVALPAVLLEPVVVVAPVEEEEPVVVVAAADELLPPVVVVAAVLELLPVVVVVAAALEELVVVLL